MLGYGGPLQIATSVIVFVLAVVFFRATASDESVFTQVDWAIAVVKALLGVGIFAFILNLVITPYKMLLEERHAWGQERSSLLARITTLEATANSEQAARQAREQSGAALAHVARAGHALYAKIIKSDDAWSIEAVRDEYRRWREHIHEASPSGAIAQAIDSIPTVNDAAIMGMPPSTDRAERTRIALHVHARLDRLSRVLENY